MSFVIPLRWESLCDDANLNKTTETRPSKLCRFCIQLVLCTIPLSSPRDQQSRIPGYFSLYWISQTTRSNRNRVSTYPLDDWWYIACWAHHPKPVTHISSPINHHQSFITHQASVRVVGGRVDSGCRGLSEKMWFVWSETWYNFQEKRWDVMYVTN